MRSPLPRGQVTDLQFDNQFIRSLPADEQRDGPSRQVHSSYSFVTPTPVSAPKLLAWSKDAAALLGLGEPEDPDLAARVFSGNDLLPGSEPYATCYGGHQFGNWAGQLGDGRAIMLGEAIGAAGKRWEIQLKGAGKTPYSRWADGRAVLRSSLREYVCSEAMHHLGVPTTRALCLVATGEGVERDMFYNGHPRDEPGAIVTRLAPSFVRFGHFELPASRGDLGLQRQLLDHVITTHFPHLGSPSSETYLAWFDEVCQRTATLIAHWMRVGFVHGVMNTDNLSVLGLTIDYGPYGWLDSFDPSFTPNTTDRGGRYSFGNQPQIGAWNLACLAQAIAPVADDVEALRTSLQRYKETFEASHARHLRDKLGLPLHFEAEQTFALSEKLFALFAGVETDMTLFFRALAELTETAPETAAARLANTFYAPPNDETSRKLVTWLTEWQREISLSLQAPDSGEVLSARAARMNGANPWIIPRNYLVQQTIDAAEGGDLGPLERLMEALRDPYTAQPGMEDLTARRPDWARNAPGCSALSCSS